MGKIDPAQYAEVNTEHAHQTALFIALTELYDTYPKLKLLFAIPNGGKRDAITAGRLKAEGVKAGVPDLMLPVPRYVNTPGFGTIVQHLGLFIELKRVKTSMKRAGTVGIDQDAWHQALTLEGYHVATCYGWKEARSAIFWYLKLDGA